MAEFCAAEASDFVTVLQIRALGPNAECSRAGLVATTKQPKRDPGVGCHDSLCDSKDVSIPNDLLQVLVAGKERIGVFQFVVKVAPTAKPLDVFAAHEVAIRQPTGG